MTESENRGATNRLVEHFFRHEYAKLVAILTRNFGLSRIELVEDMVAAAMLEAMNSWKQGGLPTNPAGWIHRVARNRILDSLRREKTHEKALAFSGLLTGRNQSDPFEDPFAIDEAEVPDSLLRMMFVCCHPILDRQSQIALTLKILCGFSVAEVARGLLTSTEAAKKRIQRAKARLVEEQISFELPGTAELQSRLSVVHAVLYLMFNEGYSTTHGIEPIRDEVCEEAARLCHLLCQHESLCTPESCALLALMLFHASRLDSRTDSMGNIVLLEDQDRGQWDQALIAVADHWLIRSVQKKPSRFHFEAVIAQFHCRASSLAETDWEMIIKFYDRLMELYPSAIYRLNRAIAIGQTGDLVNAHDEIKAIRDSGELPDYYLLDCAAGHICELADDTNGAVDAYLAALSHTIADHQRELITTRLKRLNGETTC